MAPAPGEPHLAGELLLPRRPGSADRIVRRSLQPSSLPRKHQQPYTSRCLLRARASNFRTTRKDQIENDENPALAMPPLVP